MLLPGLPAQAGGSEGGGEDCSQFSTLGEQPIKFSACREFAFADDRQPVNGLVGFVDNDGQARDEFRA